MSKLYIHDRSDRLGISLSVLCLIHCLVLPPFLAVLPLIILEPLPGWLHDSEWFHATLLFPVLLISGPVLAAGGKYDRSIWILAFLAFGLLTFALAVEPELIEQLVTMSGAVLLVIAHIKNRKVRKLSR